MTPPRELSPVQALRPRYLEREVSPGERTFSTFSSSSGREEYRQNFSTYHPNMRDEYFKRKDEYQRQEEYRPREEFARPREEYQPNRAPDHWERRSSALEPSFSSQRVFSKIAFFITKHGMIVKRGVDKPINNLISKYPFSTAK